MSDQNQWRTPGGQPDANGSEHVSGEGERDQQRAAAPDQAPFTAPEPSSSAAPGSVPEGGPYAPPQGPYAQPQNPYTQPQEPYAQPQDPYAQQAGGYQAGAPYTVPQGDHRYGQQQWGQQQYGNGQYGQPQFGAQPDPYAKSGSGQQAYGQPQYGQQYGTQYGQQYGSPAQSAGYGYGYQPYAQRQKVSVLSVLSICFGAGAFLPFFWFIAILLGPAGAILGHIALPRFRTSGERGRGLAIAGIVTGWAATAIWILVVVLVFSLRGHAGYDTGYDFGDGSGTSGA